MLGGVLTVAVLLLIGGLAYGGARAVLRDEDERWDRAARLMGLRYRSGLVRRGVLSGRFHGLAATLRVTRPVGKQGYRLVRLEVECPGAPAGLTLAPEGRLTALKKTLVGEDLLVHDPAFDAAVSVAGDEDAALAALSAPARQALRELFSAFPDARVSDGRIELDLRFSKDQPEFLLQQPLEAMVLVSERFEPVRVPEGLARNARDDPEPGVRKRNLEALLRRHAGSEPAVAAARAGLVDPDPLIRLAAALHLPAEESVEALAGLVRERSAPADARAAALERLAACRPYEEIAPLVRLALGSSEGRERCGALTIAARARDPAALDAVAGLLAGAGAPPAMAAQAAAALEHLGARAEPALVALLTADRAEVAQAAARALGAVGTVRAVEPLLSLSRAGSGLREAASEAVRGIQSRLAGASAGQVSLSAVDGAEAGLSLAPGEEESPAAGPRELRRD